ncbi:MAG: SDR family oxidoreductase [Alphaproteobacteria bacterium]
MNSVENKVIVITGASRGIGAATARHLARLGARVVLAARDAQAIGTLAQEIEAAGGTASALAGDVSRFEDVRAVMDHAVQRHGRLDVLVNNAGVIDPIARLTDSDPEAWSRVVDINLKGVYYGMRLAIPDMLKGGGGTVINISSGAATGALEGWSHYCATKAAVLSLTRCGHKEYGDRGITVVGLSPGTVATDMQVLIKDSGVNPVSQLDPSVHIPSEWVAQAIAHLCGPLGRDYAGTDFTLKTDEERARVGLPPIGG